LQNFQLKDNQSPPFHKNTKSPIRNDFDKILQLKSTTTPTLYDVTEIT